MKGWALLRNPAEHPEQQPPLLRWLQYDTHKNSVQQQTKHLHMLTCCPYRLVKHMLYSFAVQSKYYFHKASTVQVSWTT